MVRGGEGGEGGEGGGGGVEEVRGGCFDLYVVPKGRFSGGEGGGEGGEIMRRRKEICILKYNYSYYKKQTFLFPSMKNQANNQ